MTVELSPAEMLANGKMLARIAENDLDSPWLDTGERLPRIVDVLVATYAFFGMRLPNVLTNSLLTSAAESSRDSLALEIRLWNTGIRKGWKSPSSRTERTGKLIYVLLQSSGLLPGDLDEACGLQELVFSEADKMKGLDIMAISKLFSQRNVGL